jgi:hypothetical protein
MRRLVLPGVVVVLVTVAVVVVVVFFRHDGAGGRAQAAAPAATGRARSAGSAPAGAIAAVRQLTTGASAAEQRAAVAPALATELPPGQLFPAGTSFTPLSGSWAQSGDYAHLTGTLREPGASPAQVEIGLILSGGRWLVTFEERT